MRKLTRNPAIALRETLAPLHPAGLFRWDMSGWGLLVSDAPGRGAAGEAFAANVKRLGLRAREARGLLHVDCPADAYAALLRIDFCERGAWDSDWFELQALLASVLERDDHKGDAGLLGPDERLMRKAMLACAQGEKRVRAFAGGLRLADAEALRAGDTASTRACAALLAHWLRVERGVGIPFV
ncbi:MAG: hypothetical protein FWF69_07335 [Firmicutes bacterium]|nr:hypothetical protein [Bacillota bacterium]